MVSPNHRAGEIEFVEESDELLADRIRHHQMDRLRYAAPDRVPEIVHRAAAATGLCIISRPVLAEGRIELLWYLQEQSISHDYHRYGNLGVPLRRSPHRTNLTLNSSDEISDASPANAPR